MGLVGVNNISQLSKTLSSLQYYGAKSVNLYIDMDYKEKKEVAAALTAIKLRINAAGRHEYTIVESTEGFDLFSYELNYRTDGNNYRRGIRITSSGAFPKNVLAIVDKVQIPADKLAIQEKQIQIEYDFMNSLRNREHTIRLFDTTTGFDEWFSLSQEQKRDLYRKSQIAEITFLKSGLKYTELNWTPQYKGITTITCTCNH